MNRRSELLKSIEAVLKDQADELKEELAAFEGAGTLVNLVEEFEEGLAKLLARQREYYIDGFTAAIEKDDGIDLEALYERLVEADEFGAEMTAFTEAFFFAAAKKLTATIMGSIDKDISFSTLSARAAAWISGWAKELSEIMKLNTHTEVEAVLTEAVKNGEGIAKVADELKELPAFDRVRARRTAITEVLRAHSASAHEAYLQSPAVVGKTWRHSGSKKNKPRKAHVRLDGKTIGLDEYFDVNGHKGLYPRDSALPASEAVSCHCVLKPQVDPDILGISQEEKEDMQRKALEDAEKQWG